MTDYSSLQNNLVACYLFNGNANDGSGNGNNGNVNAASLVPDRFNIPSSSYSFDGRISYVQISNGLPFEFSSDMTLSLWVNPSPTQITYATILDKSYVDI